MELGTPELLLILVIVILIFGVGRIGKVGSELGQGMRAFREGLHPPLKEEHILQPKEETELPEPPSPAEEYKPTL